MGIPLSLYGFGRFACYLRALYQLSYFFNNELDKRVTAYTEQELGLPGKERLLYNPRDYTSVLREWEEVLEPQSECVITQVTCQKLCWSINVIVLAIEGNTQSLAGRT
jgi:hypothetical protein